MDSINGRIKLGLSWLFIAWERLWRVFWPAVGVAGLAIACSLLNFAAHIPVWTHVLALTIFTCSFGIALWRGCLSLRWPNELMAVRRLQRINGLSHRPLETLSDGLADGLNDPESQALWRLHHQRMRAQIDALRVGLPQPRLIWIDRFAFRIGLAVLLVAGIVSAGPDAAERLQRGFMPQLALFETPPPPIIDAWVTPPAYTGVPPIFLTGPNSGTNKVVDAPTGSQLSLRISGGEGKFTINRTRGVARPEKLDEQSFGADLIVTGSESVAVALNDDVIAEWTIRTIPDAPPRAAFLSTPSEGRGNVLRIDYRASDDYGLATVRAVVVRTSKRKPNAANAPRETLELPLSRLGAKKAASSSYHDMTPHPWAGLPVHVHLEATDAAGQIGRSTPVRIILPEREFSHPVAREIVVERRKLIAEPQDADLVADALQDIAWRPGRYEDDVTVYMSLRLASRRLASGKFDLTAIQQLLWDTALRVEDGKLSIARRNVRDAEEALRKALENDVSDEDLSRLMNELESALDSYLSELSKMMQNAEPDTAQPLARDDKTMALTRRDFKNLMDEIRKLAESGSRTDAKRLLSQLQNLLENMQTGQMARMSPQGQKSMKLLNKLQGLIKDQQKLLEDTFQDARKRGQLQRMERGARRPGMRRPGQSRPGQGRPQNRTDRAPGGTPQMQPGTMPGGADQQEALRRRLGELMRELGEMTNSIPRPMGRAERSMRRSTDLLGSGQSGESITPQTRALDQLQESARMATRQLMKQMGQGVGRRPGELGKRKDPFGRTPDSNSGLNTGDVGIQEADALQKAREIRNELRRRAGQRKRPETEREYINRLLKQF